MLYENGRNINLYTNLKNRKGESSLHICAKNNYYDICKILLQHNAVLENYNDKLQTPLHYACIYGNYKIAYLLLSHANSNSSKCNINIQDKYGHTPLHYVCYLDDPILYILFVTNDKVDLTIRDKEGRNPIDIVGDANSRYIERLIHPFPPTNDDIAKESIYYYYIYITS